MNFIDISLTIELLSNGNLVEEAHVHLDSDNPLLKKFILLNIESEELGADFFDDFNSIPHSIRSFINYFKTYHYNILHKEGTSRLILALPIDFYFLEKLFDFNTYFIIDEKRHRVKLNSKTIPLKVNFDTASNTVSLYSRQNGLLIKTNSGNFLLSDNKLQPILTPFSESIVTQLFREREIVVENDLKIRLLSQKKDNPELIEKYVDLPEVGNFNKPTIVLYFSNNNMFFNIRAFVEATLDGTKYQSPLNFSEIRKNTLLSEEILLSYENDKFFISYPDTDFYEQLRDFVTSVFNEFFEFLREIDGNQIRTRDNENLFQKFFANVNSYVEIRSDTSDSLDNKIVYINEKFDNKKIEFVETDNTPADNGGFEYFRIDWLEIKFQYKIANVILNLAELKQIVSEGFIFKNNRIITTKQEEIELLRTLFDETKIHRVKSKNDDDSKDKYLLSRYNLPFIMKHGIDIDLPEELKELVNMLSSDKAIRKIKIPPTQDKILRDYQKIGVYWLHFLHHYRFAGILADEMGLGKTVQVLTFLKTIQGSGVSLIVCPSSLTYNWAAEIKKFFGKELSYIIIDGTKETRVEKLKKVRNYDIAITSYYMVHLDNEDYSKVGFNYCILDEAQHIKNKKAKRTKSIKKLRCKNRLAITGTPLENNITELWSIFDFLMPGFLGTHQWFKNTFENPINGFNKNEQKIAFTKLKSLIKPFLLRRTKNVVYKELPPKIEQIIYMELGEKQKAIYLDTLSRIKNQYQQVIKEKGVEKSYIDFLAALTRLRQVCLHPGLVEPELLENDEEDLSVKLPALIELINEAMDSGHRVLVFSQYVKMLKIIRNEFHKQEIEYLYIDGKTKDRVGLVDHFNKSKIPVFLISLRAGGTGLNLVGANSVILFDPWWNPAVENQAIDRAHRIGQTDVVNVYRLVARGTIEEKIQELQKQKNKIFNTMIEKNDEFIKKMTFKEIRSLLDMGG